MKLRLKSHSIRFRVTREEMEQLTNTGCVSCTTVVPTTTGDQRKFRYEIARTSGDISDLIFGADGFSLILGINDWLTLADAGKEGVYLRREWQDDQGRTQRTVIYVEKDHKGHKHSKREKHKNDKDRPGSGS